MVTSQTLNANDPMLKTPSPNFDDRPAGRQINMMVIHYTGMKSGAAALERMCGTEYKVSAHYFISRQGKIHQLVDEEKRAWHAGRSSWRGKAECNDFSIGIELENKGHEWGYEEFPAEQMQSLLKLSKEIVKRHDIAPSNIVGHSDIAPLRKTDPGEKFDWQWLAKNGIGIWPDYELNQDLLKNSAYSKDSPEDQIAGLRKLLSNAGYNISLSGSWDEELELIITAFRRRFLTPALELDYFSEMDLVVLKRIN